MITQILYELLPVRKGDLSLQVPSGSSILQVGQQGVGLLVKAGRELLHGVCSLPVTTYVYLVLWLAGAALFYYWDFTSLYMILTGFLLVFTNLGERKEGELSAYSVFNEGFQELMGTLNANQIDDQLRHRGARLDAGRGRGRRGGQRANQQDDTEEEDNFSDLLEGDSEDEQVEDDNLENKDGQTVDKVSYEERLRRRHESRLRMLSL